MTTVDSRTTTIQAAVVPNTATLADGAVVAMPTNGTSAQATFFRLLCANDNARVIQPPTGLEFAGAQVVLALYNNSGGPLTATTFDPTIGNFDAVALPANGEHAYYQLIFNGVNWDVFAVGGGVAGFQTVVVALTSADILALSTTPVVAIPAPGAGKFISLKAFAATRRNGSSTYEASGVVVGATLNPDLGTPGNTIFPFGDDLGSIATGGFDDANTIGAGTDGPKVGIPVADVENKPAVIFANGPLTGGPINSVTLDVGGAGYTIGDLVDVDGVGLLSSAQLQVDTVDGGGAVTGFTVINPGGGYVPGTGVGTTGGTGTGFTVDVNSVIQGDGEITVKYWYTIEDIDL
jgi:hypothetical protein